MRPLLSLVLLAVLTACSPNDNPVNVQFTVEERQRIDELVIAELATLRPEMDSLCQETFDDRVAVAVDSIIQVRLEEEARLRARVNARRQ